MPSGDALSGSDENGTTLIEYIYMRKGGREGEVRLTCKKSARCSHVACLHGNVVKSFNCVCQGSFILVFDTYSFFSLALQILSGDFLTFILFLCRTEWWVKTQFEVDLCPKCHNPSTRDGRVVSSVTRPTAGTLVKWKTEYMNVLELKFSPSDALGVPQILWPFPRAVREVTMLTSSSCRGGRGVSTAPIWSSQMRKQCRSEDKVTSQLGYTRVPQVQGSDSRATEKFHDHTAHPTVLSTKRQTMEHLGRHEGVEREKELQCRRISMSNFSAALLRRL